MGILEDTHKQLVLEKRKSLIQSILGLDSLEEMEERVKNLDELEDESKIISTES